MFEEGFSGKETFDAKFEGGKEVNHVDIWGRTFKAELEILNGEQVRCA